MRGVCCGERKHVVSKRRRVAVEHSILASVLATPKHLGNAVEKKIVQTGRVSSGVSRVLFSFPTRQCLSSGDR